MKAYLADSDVEAVINVGADMRKIHQCFRIMKVPYFVYEGLTWLSTVFQLYNPFYDKTNKINGYLCVRV